MNKKYNKKLKIFLPGIEPGTYRVLGGRHNQLDHRNLLCSQSTENNICDKK